MNFHPKWGPIQRVFSLSAGILTATFLFGIFYHFTQKPGSTLAIVVISTASLAMLNKDAFLRWFFNSILLTGACFTSICEAGHMPSEFSHFAVFLGLAIMGLSWPMFQSIYQPPWARNSRN